MTGDILSLLGGIGLFLFGMHTMTSALRELASERMRELLAGFTRTPLSGALTGAATTAAIQSSTATIMMTVGFVGAGLVAFPQALGILYGASLGTTFTGWIVLVVGLRLQLGTVALGLLFVASLAALLGKGTVARAGRGLAGFALIFIGIDLMQEAMAGYQGRVTPDDFPTSATLAGRLALIGIGLAITTITQSSSAGVAAALVMLAGGAVSFEQAAALVIGMHVGTAVSSSIAAIGGTRAVVQTAFANVVYHAATGLLALPLIDLFSWGLAAGMLGGDATLMLVLFHTGFNLVGMAVMLPLTNAFAAAVQWLLPERVQDTPASRLDRRLLDDPAAALDTSARVLRELAEDLFAALAAALRPGAPPEGLAAASARVGADLPAVQEFLARIRVPDDRTAELERLNAQLQEFDHLRRLQYRCTQAARMRGALREPRLGRPVALLRGTLERQLAGEGTPEALTARLGRLEARLGRTEARVRHATQRHPPYWLGLTVADVMRLSDALRWMRRSTRHVQRIVFYQALAWQPPAPKSPEAEAEEEVVEAAGPAGAEAADGGAETVPAEARRD